MTDKIRISEIFGPTLQGEGSVIGVPSVFVRTGGCDYRCTWCDTPHAVDVEYRRDWTAMSTAEIWDKVRELSGGKPLTVTLSGGNPAIQPLGGLIALGKAQGYGFVMETQGSVAQDWFSGLDVLTLSPKPPSSGMETDWRRIDDCLEAAGEAPEITLKIVVFDEADYCYAKATAARYPQLPVYLQPGNDVGKDKDTTDRMRWLVAHTLRDGWYEAKILPQLHVMLWGNKRGV